MKERIERVGSVAGVQDNKPAEIGVYVIKQGETELISIGPEGSRRLFFRMTAIPALTGLLKAAERTAAVWPDEPRIQ
jgi:hypothetical protein